MKFKPVIKPTIKLMLGVLIFTGIISTAFLMWVSIRTNKVLIANQNQLTEIVLPLDHTNQKVKLAVVNLNKRQHSITISRSLQEVKNYARRDHLEIEFDKGIQDLKVLADKTDGMLQHNDIEPLVAVYRETLKNDTDFLTAVQNRFAVQDEINNRISELQGVSAKLQANAEKLNGIISQQITRYMSTGDNKNEAMPGVAREFFRNDLINAQNLSSHLRLSIAGMVNYGSRVLLAVDEESVREINIKNISRAANQIENAYENLLMGVLSEESTIQLINDMKTDYQLMKSILVTSSNSIIMLKRQLIELDESITLFNRQLNNKSLEMDRLLKELLQKSDSVRIIAEQKAMEASKNAKGMILGVGSLGMLFMMFAGLIIYRRIIHPINKVVNFADYISKGDLTVHIEKDHDDEIGDLVIKFSLMAKSLSTLIGQVQRSGIQITSSATELTATSKQQEAVMKTQVESTNYVVKAVGEISRVSSELVKTMQQVAMMSDKTAEFANSGQTDLMQMETAMRHMENASKSISGKLEAINEKAANITSVVTTITKVADQTDLLSLNASIEAEKAGESGRGFTVVAREIRRLADQTAVATLDIDKMVKEMQSAVSAGVMEMDAFITEVQRSAESVGKISKQLNRIIEQVQALSPSFEGVKESMQIQSENANKINGSMLNLSEELQQTVDSLRESFMAIEQLNHAARGLQDEVSRFKVVM